MVSAISFKKKYFHRILLFLLLAVVIIFGSLLFYNIAFMNRVYPNILIAGIDVGGKAPKDAVLLLSQNITLPAKISLTSQSQSFELDTKEIDVNYDFGISVERAYNLARTGNVFLDTVKRIGLIYAKENIGLTTKINEEKLSDFISVVAGQVSVSPVYPSVKFVNDNIQIEKGTPGSRIDTQLLKANIGYNLSYVDNSNVTIPLTIIDPTLNEQEVASVSARAEKYLGKNIILNFESQKFNYNQNDLLGFINPKGGYYEQALTDAISKVALNINRDPQNPKFEFEGNRVTEFLPASDGVTLDNQKLKDLLVLNLNNIAESTDKNIVLDVPVTRTSPDIKTGQVNDLGIKELIGRGESTYYHSIPGRVFNVNLAAGRINGTLVKPGETFSFNQTLGDVSKLTGYKEAYIISGGRTILGDGGGVCQVSTTLFRSVLNAGLPVVERAAHAYRVGYYEQNSPPGIDATVYSPSPDFKFINDTPNHILIRAKNDSKRYSLIFELYGTSDGRVVTISKPVTSNVKPALPTVYQEDPTLPAGTQKQVDYAASGARVVFNYSVTRSGEQIYKKTFVSNYQPWAAVYLKGTGPAI
jgi:vancomycin resistance protein YoaR